MCQGIHKPFIKVFDYTCSNFCIYKQLTVGELGPRTKKHNHHAWNSKYNLRPQSEVIFG